MIYKIIKEQIEEYDGQNENLLMQLRYFMIYVLLLKEPQIVIGIDRGFLVPFQKVRIKERLILYGGGKFGSTLYRFINEQRLCKIVLWVDKVEDNSRGIENSLKLDEIEQESYDRIIISVLVRSVADEIQEELIKKGITRDRIARIDITDDIIIRSKKWKAFFGEQ